MAQPNAVDQSELEWVQLRRDIYDQVETPREKFMRKFKQAPLVPIGEFNSLSTPSSLCSNMHRLTSLKTMTLCLCRMLGNCSCFVLWSLQLPKGEYEDVTDDDASSNWCARFHICCINHWCINGNSSR